mmetsp:Transcript_21857/g.27937  ORF Transcript_21857/g.27937 Transcript_21857/m.27937 type:complete len:965 (+) Transcript_21857:122-3016(+)|eukprot:CAMPEP_0204873062 /NCGR_PEP_ID=MMETSP1348-20121228/39600_1 /ASSEMBLY_ACC=CAM_ASM_000700 /TAXON_ID=215587 /ORGANISM="Aplanochytrium stocchinoi, Strain GSBS06" /LENGTH=964 /DNA_ID=CAMNT_0052028201 /DNA_START=40 /DNA_END=2934 /DNA_ORIENTATION=+
MEHDNVPTFSCSGGVKVNANAASQHQPLHYRSGNKNGNNSANSRRSPYMNTCDYNNPRSESLSVCSGGGGGSPLVGSDGRLPAPTGTDTQQRQVPSFSLSSNISAQNQNHHLHHRRYRNYQTSGSHINNGNHPQQQKPVQGNLSNRNAKDLGMLSHSDRRSMLKPHFHSYDSSVKVGDLNTGSGTDESGQKQQPKAVLLSILQSQQQEEQHRRQHYYGYQNQKQFQQNEFQPPGYSSFYGTRYDSENSTTNFSVPSVSSARNYKQDVSINLKASALNGGNSINVNKQHQYAEDQAGPPSFSEFLTRSFSSEQSVEQTACADSSNSNLSPLSANSDAKHNKNSVILAPSSVGSVSQLSGSNVSEPMEIPSFSSAAKMKHFDRLLQQPEENDGSKEDLNMIKHHSHESKQSSSNSAHYAETGIPKQTNHAYFPAYRSNPPESIRLELKSTQENEQERDLVRSRKRFISIFFAGVFSLILVILIIVAVKDKVPEEQTIFPYGDTGLYKTYLDIEDEQASSSWCADRTDCHFVAFFGEELALVSSKFSLDALHTDSADQIVKNTISQTTNIFQMPYLYPYILELSVIRDPPQQNVSLRIPIPKEVTEHMEVNANVEGYGIDVLAKFEQNDPLGGSRKYAIYEMLERFVDSDGFEWVNIPSNAFFKQNFQYSRTRYTAQLLIGYSLGIAEVAPVPTDENGVAPTRLLQGQSENPVCQTARLLCPFLNGENCETEIIPFVPDRSLGITFKSKNEINVLPASPGIVKQKYFDDQTQTWGVVIQEKGDRFVRTLYLGLDQVFVEKEAEVNSNSIGTLPRDNPVLHMQSLPRQSFFQTKRRKSRVDPNPCLERTSNAKVVVTDIGVIKDDKFKLTLTAEGKDTRLTMEPDQSVCDELEISQVFEISANLLRTLNTINLKIEPDNSYNVMEDFDKKATFKIKLDGLFFNDGMTEKIGILNKNTPFVSINYILVS